MAIRYDCWFVLSWSLANMDYGIGNSTMALQVSLQMALWVTASASTGLWKCLLGLCRCWEARLYKGLSIGALGGSQEIPVRRGSSLFTYGNLWQVSVIWWWTVPATEGGEPERVAHFPFLLIGVALRPYNWIPHVGGRMSVNAVNLDLWWNFSHKLRNRILSHYCDSVLKTELIFYWVLSTFLCVLQSQKG